MIPRKLLVILSLFATLLPLLPMRAIPASETTAAGALNSELVTSGSLQPLWPEGDAFPGMGLKRSNPQLEAKYNVRRAGFRADAAANHGKVVFLGDSITERIGNPESLFPKYQCVNRGIGGDFTRGLLYRVDEDVLALEPKAVVVLIGTNDLGDGNTPHDVVANIRVLVEKMRAVRPSIPIILCKIMPRGKHPGLFPKNIQAVNAELAKIAQSTKGVSLCDTWTPFDDGTGSSRKEDMPDMLHPNASGYAKYAAAVGPVLDHALASHSAK